MMNESTKITDTKLTPSLKAAIKTHFPGVVTLGELKQFISDDPKALDYFSQRAVDIIMNILDFTDYDGAVSEPPATKQETALADAVKHAYDVHAQIILGAKMVENGLYLPTIKRLSAILNAYHVSYDDVIFMPEDNALSVKDGDNQ